MAKNDNLKKALQTTQGPPDFFRQKMRGWLSGNRKSFEAIASSKEEADRIMASLVQSASKTPRLMDCTPESLGVCLVASAQTGLYPGGLGGASYVPFRNGKKGVYEAVWVPSYDGLCGLALRSGVCKSIAADVVYENDEFYYDRGTTNELSHRILLRGDRGERVCAWVVVAFSETSVVHVFTLDRLFANRDRSQAAKSSDSPWNGTQSDVDEMLKKTALKLALKTVPKNPKLANAIAQDNAAERPNVAAKPTFAVENVTIDELAGAAEAAETATPTAGEVVG